MNFLLLPAAAEYRTAAWRQIAAESLPVNKRREMNQRKNVRGAGAE